MREVAGDFARDLHRESARDFLRDLGLRDLWLVHEVSEKVCLNHHLSEGGSQGGGAIGMGSENGAWSDIPETTVSVINVVCYGSSSSF